MTHHACAAVRRLLVVVLAPVLAVALVACSGSDSGSGGGTETSTLTVMVQGAAPLSGLQLDLIHGTQLTVTGIASGGIAGATCQQNVEPARVRIACVISGSATPPFTAWTLTVEHDAGLEPLDYVASVACSGSGTTGLPVEVGCTVE